MTGRIFFGDIDAKLTFGMCLRENAYAEFNKKPKPKFEYVVSWPDKNGSKRFPVEDPVFESRNLSVSVQIKGDDTEDFLTKDAAFYDMIKLGGYIDVSVEDTGRTYKLLYNGTSSEQYVTDPNSGRPIMCNFNIDFIDDFPQDVVQGDIPDPPAAKLSQTITFPAISAKLTTSPDFDPGATASSGLAVTYFSSNHSVATIVAGQVHIVGAGTSVITARQGGDSEYNPASAVTQVLTVGVSVSVYYGSSAAQPVTESNVTALTGVSYSAPIELNTGTVNKFFNIVIPAANNIASVEDLDAPFAPDVTVNYIFKGNVTVGGNSMKIFTMEVGLAYSSNHRHLITLS